MNEFDKNFHINFSPLYFAFAFMVFMLWASEAKASDIEEVIVVAQQERTVEADPVINSRLVDAIMPIFTYNPGGYGGFIGYNERGAQTVHTSVIVNGIPANDPGASWYDFGHDFASGQSVKVVTGANGVLYGSGSIAGTVLIQDTIEHGFTVRGGDQKYYRVAPIDQLEFSMVDASMVSARNDNDEEDNYTNKTARFNVDAGDFTIVGKYSEYEYDYDNCYDYDWGQSNDCLQDGTRYNIAIRNDLMTIGRNYNTADYFTVEDPTYSNESYRDFVRFGGDAKLSNKIEIAYGIDAEKIYYNTNSWQNIEGTMVVETEITEPGIWYAEDDTNKVRPMWTGIYIGTGEINSETVGDGVFTLTEVKEKYTDENAGAYFTVNADFVLKYNFGIRVGNDDQNAYRFGIENGPWFFNMGDSFRKPNLYELNGDGFVTGNPDLLPEQGVGYEIGYGAISIFRYEFEESIEYVPSVSTDFTTTSIVLDAEATLNQIGTNPEAPDSTYVSCVLDPNWNANDEETFELPGCIYKSVSTVNQIYTAPTYSNTGEYVTQGIRFNNVFGPVTVNLKWTDTEQPRVPEYAGAITMNQNFKGVDFRLRYAVNLNRKPGEWDFIEDEYLEDLERLDINITKRFANGVTLSLNVENLTDEVVEVVPYYNSTQRQTTLVLDYKW